MINYKEVKAEDVRMKVTGLINGAVTAHNQLFKYGCYSEASYHKGVLDGLFKMSKMFNLDIDFDLYFKQLEK
jgi:hypothetical protein